MSSEEAEHEISKPIFPQAKNRTHKKSSKAVTPIPKKTIDSVRALVLKRHEAFQNRLRASPDVSPRLLKSWESVKTALDKGLALKQRMKAASKKRKAPPPTVSKARKAKAARVSDSDSEPDNTSKKELLTNRAIAKLLSHELLEEVSGLKSNDATDEEPHAWDTL
jgi:hypothetical protein